MRVIGRGWAWVKSHPRTVVVVALVAWFVLYRLSGKGRGGHATPMEAAAAGWEVYPAGITGWKEVEPGTGREFWHMTGYSPTAVATG